ncbi:hypothetical protein SDC9_177515 [bioreactor metagenome]|uniref:Uncharacterized protein n=1 Tax=bioreactor metagenome TaxID=1076179 RepID=A0A645GT81_9ZZZZ
MLVSEELSGIARPNRSAVVDDNQLFRFFANLLAGMLNSENRRILFLIQIIDRGIYFFPAQRVEFRRRFIQHDNLWLHRQYAGNCQPLLFSAGKLAGLALFIAFQPDAAKRFLNAPVNLLSGYQIVARAECNILFHGGAEYLRGGVLHDDANIFGKGLNSIF